MRQPRLQASRVISCLALLAVAESPIFQASPIWIWIAVAAWMVLNIVGLFAMGAILSIGVLAAGASRAAQADWMPTPMIVTIVFVAPTLISITVSELWGRFVPPLDSKLHITEKSS